MILFRKVGFVLSIALGTLILTMSGLTSAAIDEPPKFEGEDAKEEIMAVLIARLFYACSPASYSG